MKLRWMAALAAALTGCAATLPPGWDHGGATLIIPRARWVVGEIAVELHHDGVVMLDGQHAFSIDRAGRVFEPDGTALALVDRDGQLVGIDDEPLGWVGAGQTMLPGDDAPWLTLMRSGELVRTDERGQRRPFGVWIGCTQYASTAQSCALVSHLVGRQLRRARQHARGPSLGVGLGVSVPIR